MFNGIAAFNQLFSGFRQGGQDVSANAGQAGAGQLSVSQLSLDIEYSSTEVHLGRHGRHGHHDNGSNSVELRQFSAQIFETRISGRLGGFQRPVANPYQAQVPSPQDVAGKVLGFVEQRIAQEAANGASPERLEELFNQAAEGVERGYGEALEELDARGLITEDLQADIDEGHDLIQSGLADLREKYLPSDNPEADAAADDANADTSSTDIPVPTNVGEQDAQSDDVDGSAGNTESNSASRPAFSRFAQALAFNHTQFAANDVGLTITTQDGDKVTISVSAMAGSQLSGSYASRGRHEALNLSQTQFEASGFELKIDGELDEGELTALEELLAQVEDIAGTFFSGDLDSAFAAALDLNADIGEIASYAISMTQMQYEEVGVSYKAHRPAVADRFQPLADQVPKYAKALAEASHFADPVNLISSVIDRILDKGAEERSGVQHNFADFSHRLLQQLSAR